MTVEAVRTDLLDMAARRMLSPHGRDLFLRWFQTPELAQDGDRLQIVIMARLVRLEYRKLHDFACMRPDDGPPAFVIR